MKKANFSKMFNEIYAKNGKELEMLHKQALTRKIINTIGSIIMIIGGFWCIYWLSNTQIIHFSIYILVLGIFLMNLIHQHRLKNDYIVRYKELAIKTLINGIDDSYQYIPNGSGVNISEYRASRFDNGQIDEYYTEDSIIGNINENTNFMMSQIKTIAIVETIDSEGRRTTERSCTFLGLYGIINLPVTIGEDILISNNSKFLKFNDARVEMESEEFEKFFDVFSLNRQKAMEILTPNVIEELIKIRNSIKGNMQFRITENRIYFRISCGDIFEPPSYKSGVDFNVLYRYFNMIELPKTIYEALIDNILMISNDKDSLKNREMDKMSDEKRKEAEENLKKNEESGWFSTT